MCCSFIASNVRMLKVRYIALSEESSSSIRIAASISIDRKKGLSRACEVMDQNAGQYHIVLRRVPR